MKKAFLLLMATLVASFCFAQNNDGHFRSRQSGYWGDSSTWQIRIASLWYNASCAPSSNDTVSVQSTHTITLDTITTTTELYLNTSAVIACGSYTLCLQGRIHAYTGSAIIGDSDAVYTPATNPSSGNITCGLGGRLKFVGCSRSLTLAGAWGSNGLTTSAVVEFALNSGCTATMNTGFKASSIIISSGIVVMNSFRMAPDAGASGQGNLTIDSGATLISSSSGSSNQVLSRTTGAATGVAGTLTVYGTLRLHGISPHVAFSSIIFAAGSTVEYGGASQNFLNATYTGAVKPSNYYHITLSNSGTKTLTAATVINGTLTLQGATTLGIGAHSLTYGAGATLQYKGNNTQNTGNTPTEWPVVGAPSNIIINNAQGVTLGVSRRISGCLHLVNGKLTSTHTNLLLLDSGASCIGASDSSFVNGPIKKSGNSAFRFPVGKSGFGLHPIEISAPTSVTDTFTAEYVRKSAFDLGDSLGAYISAIDSCEYWELSSTNQGSIVDVTLHGNSLSGCGNNSGIDFFTGGGSTLNTLRVVQWNGITWENAATGITTYTGSSPDVTLTAEGVNTFGIFTFGSIGNNPLPVTLVSFNAQWQIPFTSILLTWCTASEKDNNRFEIERSIDGNNYFVIGKVAGNGTSRNLLHYSYTDNTLQYNPSNTYYYRLKQVDFSGAFAYSPICVLNSEIKNTPYVLSIKPIPLVDELTLNVLVPFSGIATVNISDITGKVRLADERLLAKGANTMVLNTTQLSSGAYFITFYFEHAVIKTSRIYKN